MLVFRNDIKAIKKTNHVMSSFMAQEPLYFFKYQIHLIHKNSSISNNSV